MKLLTSVCGILAVLGIVCMATGQDGAAKKEMEKLQGTWRVVSIEVEGKMAPADYAKRLTYTFKGDKVHFLGDNTTPGADLEYTYTLDPTKKPKAIDMKLVRSPDKKGIGEIISGIYELDGDSLKICTGKKRPSEFSTKAKSSGGLVVLKREKK